MAARRPSHSQASRAPSPTNTTYSGISTYRSEYTMNSDLSHMPLPTNVNDSKAIARAHFDEMAIYLENYLAKEPPNARSSAREKLKKLTRQQFQELSTDVYDELLRRRDNAEREELPFLPVRDDFHPKRNQARQKLATLPVTRFKDLSSDVFHELGRRYPEFKEPDTSFPLTSPGSNYEDTDVGTPSYVRSPPSPMKPLVTLDYEQSNKNNFVPPLPEKRFIEEEYDQKMPIDSYRNRSDSKVRKPSEDSYGAGRRSNDEKFGRDEYRIAGRKPSVDLIANLRNEERRRASPDLQGHARRPSADRTRELDDSLRRQSPDIQGHGRKPSADRRNPSDDYLGHVPKSSLDRTRAYGREEERKTRSPDFLGHGRKASLVSQNGEPHDELRRGLSPELHGHGRKLSDDRSRNYGRNDTSIGSALNIRKAATSAANAQREMIVPTKSSMTEEDIEVPYSRERESSSTAAFNEGSSRSPEFRNVEPRRRDVEHEQDLQDSDLDEPRTLSVQVGGLNMLGARLQGRTFDYDEPVNDGARTEDIAVEDRKTRLKLELQQQAQDQKINDLQEELNILRQERVDLQDQLKIAREREEEQHSVILSLKDQMEVMKEDFARGKDADRQHAENVEYELQRYKELYERIQPQQEKQSKQNSESLDTLRMDLEELLSELTELSKHNDELLAAKDADAERIRQLESQLKERERKDTSERSNSQDFPPIPQMDYSDSLSGPSNDTRLEFHLKAFFTAINNLLTSARSKDARGVLTPMKAVVDGVTVILEDQRSFTRLQGDPDPDHTYELRDRTEATLSNLVTASRTYADSLGLSPVSLLDAAASHLCSAITDIAKTLRPREPQINGVRGQ